VGLNARPETEYYEDLSSKTREIVVLTTILVSIMAGGAVFAVANAMYAAVDGRKREIAMLRTIGFKRRSILAAFLIESLLICVGGCALGLLAGTFLDGSKEDFLSDTTWTVLAYELSVTPRIIFTALILAATLGIVGAMAPAVRAARTPMIEALRKA
jgi:ABC-type antimicrobial peptide transport system permease subunit